MGRNPWITGSQTPPPEPEENSGTDETAPASSEEDANPAYSFAAAFLGGRNDAQEAAHSGATQAGPGAETSLPQRAEAESAPPQEEATPEPDAASRRPRRRELLRRLQKNRVALRQGDLAALAKREEKRVVSNYRSLSLVEGNLLGLSSKAQCVYYTSCFAGEGKTTAAIQAAYGLAIYGKRNVLLCESDSDKPRLPSCFRMNDGTPGLQEVLRGDAECGEAIGATRHEQLYVLPAGEGHEPLRGAQFEQLLETLKANFDYILVDGKSLLSSSEVSMAASCFDCLLLVVESRRTKWEVVQMAHEKLVAAGAKSAGIVLNRRRFYVPAPVYRLLSK